MIKSPNTAILLVAHGTVRDLADLPAFVARIRHGRPPPPGLVDELRRRYEAIGGSPLLRVTEEQARALEAHTGLPVLLGMRLWEPSVESAFVEAARRELKRLVLVPLAPFSVDVYGAAARRSLEAARVELGAGTPELVVGQPWGCEPAFIAAQCTALSTLLRIDSRDSAVDGHRSRRVGSPTFQILKEGRRTIQRLSCALLLCSRLAVELPRRPNS